MSKQNTHFRVPEEPSEELRAERLKNLEFHTAFIRAYIQQNEEAILDTPTPTLGFQTDCYRKAEQYSKILMWLIEVKKNRYTIPDIIKKQEEKAKLNEEDAKRLADNPVEGKEQAKLIEMP